MNDLDAVMIVTCKNRLPLLQQALPTMISQSTSFTYKVAVVDYGCPQNTFEYCKKLNIDKLIAIKVLDDVGGFSHSRSRNCGVTNTNSNILIFMDSDVILHKDWLESAVKPILDNSVVCTSPKHNMPLYWKGLCAVRRDVFMNAGGFDENLSGWGYEDYDLFDRVSKIGQTCNSFGAPHINILPHSNELRFLYQDDLKDYEQSNTRNKNRVINRTHLNPNGFGKGNVIKYIGNKK